MTSKERIASILREVATGAKTVEEALDALRHFPILELDGLVIDSARELRKGHPESVFCIGKTPEQVVTAFSAAVDGGFRLLGTKASAAQVEAVTTTLPVVRFIEEARVLLFDPAPVETVGSVLVLSAGSSDIPIAEEAVVAARFFGSRVERGFDVGVAGVHRIARHVDAMKAANAIVVCAGMEGALPSLVAGIADAPVIGVPTSIGYGTSLGGLTALFAMLNSCAEGLAVVNIDNGFGAGYLANLINQQAIA